MSDFAWPRPGSNLGHSLKRILDWIFLEEEEEEEEGDAAPPIAKALKLPRAERFGGHSEFWIDSGSEEEEEE